MQEAKCISCGKQTKEILVDRANGESLAFCSWDCLFKWLLINKIPHRPDVSYTRGKYIKTIKTIPSVLSMNKEGKSHREIAKVLGISINTVKSILSPNSKINTLGATSKVLRLLTSCANEAIVNSQNELDNAKDDDSKLDVACILSSPSDLIITIDSWLNVLEIGEDTPHARGVAIGLVMFEQYLKYVDKQYNFYCV